MIAVSVVIITKNKADIIPACIEKAKLITDDIIIINNNMGAEQSITSINGCRIYKKNWDGYGANKNKGIDEAKYNWILSIDADEMPDDDLIKSLHELDYSDAATVYDIKFRSYFGKKMIKYGSWGRDHHIRLFNRSLVRWLETMVHETLVLPQNVQVKKVDGYVHHYSVKDADEYESKSSYYAKLSAKKYFSTGKKANTIKLYISPVFGFLRNYIFYLGFLDGREGWQIAKITIRNTQRKYRFLKQMESIQQKKQIYNDNLVVEY